MKIPLEIQVDLEADELSLSNSGDVLVTFEAYLYEKTSEGDGFTKLMDFNLTQAVGKTYGLDPELGPYEEEELEGVIQTLEKLKALCQHHISNCERELKELRELPPIEEGDEDYE